MPINGKNLEGLWAYFSFNFSTGISLCAYTENNTIITNGGVVANYSIVFNDAEMSNLNIVANLGFFRNNTCVHVYFVCWLFLGCGAPLGFESKLFSFIHFAGTPANV